MTLRRTLYWTATAVFAAFMLMASVPDVAKASQAIDVFAHLGYPLYLLPFLGTAKILGVLAVLAPRLRTMKEWAYAGLTFDLLGALYSHLSVGDGVSAWGFPIAGLILLAGSYAARRHLSTQQRARLAPAA